MRRRLSYFLVLFAFGLLVMASACHHSSDQGPNQNGGARTENTPASKTDENSNIPTPTVSPDQPPGLDEATFFGKGDVRLKRQGSESFTPLLSGSFRLGDRLKIGEASYASVLCPDRFCKLTTGEYETCCNASCTQVAPMMRIVAGNNPPVVKKGDLSPADAKVFNEAESNIRSLNLGPVTTQFMVTKLYSGWKLEETNQELDRLTIQLAKPEAKQELQESYLPVIRKTGDMHLKLNRVEKAKELYQININSSSQTNDPIEKAAAHTGLAEAYKQSGDKTEAVRNYEIAKDIYVKQGETKAAAATEKQIANTQAVQRMDRTTLPKARAVSTKSP